MYVYNVYTVQVVPYNLIFFFFLIFYCGVSENVPADHDPRRALGSGEATEREPAPGRCRENQQRRYSNDISTNVLCFAVAADAGIRFAVARNSYLLLFYVQKSIVKPIVIFFSFFFSLGDPSPVVRPYRRARPRRRRRGRHTEPRYRSTRWRHSRQRGAAATLLLCTHTRFIRIRINRYMCVNDGSEMNSRRNVRRNANKPAGLGTLVVYSRTENNRKTLIPLFTVRARDPIRRLSRLAGTDLRFCKTLFADDAFTRIGRPPDPL